MIFENRNKHLTNLHKAADYLGRALGENLKILSVDSRDESVSFISESENVICCKYDKDNDSLRLTDFVVESSQEALSPQKLEEEIEDSISSFLDALQESQFNDADTSFDDVLDLFEKRNSLGSYQAKMQKQADFFGKATRIIESKEFKDLEEIRPNIIEYIKENIESIKENKDIRSALKINSAMSTAFRVTRLSLADLTESKEFKVNLEEQGSLYEMVCRQELVRQELLEAKSSMSTIWIDNQNVQKLSSMIFARDLPIKEALAEVVEDVPYFAFATKSDLTEMLTSLYEVNVTDVVTKKDTKEFINKIYEWKKPIKKELISILDEKYGINVANLKFVPTFNNLAKSNSVMCEVLSILGEDKNVVSDVMKTFASFIAKKGGVEVLDVSDFLSECFKAGGLEVIGENMLMSYIDMPRLAKDLMALKILIGGDSVMGGEPGAEGMEGEEAVPPNQGDEFGQEEEAFNGEEGEFGGEQNGEFGEEDQVPGENPAPGEDSEFAPESEPQAGIDPSQQDVGAEDGIPVDGQQVPPGAAPGAPEEGGIGDDSVEDGEGVPPQQGQQAPPRPGGDGGGMGSLVSDLEALVAGLGIGGKPKPKRPPIDPGNGQYGA